MKLWLLEWPDAFPDETNVMVIRAATKEEAVELAKQDQFYYHGTQHHFKYKFDNAKWTINEIRIDGETEVVVSA